MKAILIAEGDDRVAELFAYLFAHDGWTVTTCLDGQRAADALGGSVAYDAVVVSNQLHNMGGVELITRIRGLTHRQDVPIVMVTGTVECALLADALAAGADDVSTNQRLSTGTQYALEMITMSEPSPPPQETREPICPQCQGADILALGRVLADSTAIRSAYRCRVCATEFLLVSTDRRVGPRDRRATD